MSVVPIILMAATLLGEPRQDPAPSPQEATEQGQEQAVQLPDVVVDGRSLEAMVSDFVAEAAAPARGRGLARWQGRVCVGVVNLRAEAAQAIADRISELMLPLGLEPERPGCRAEVIIIFTTDGQGLARQLVEEHRRAFRVGTPGLDRGNRALEAFVASDRPIRWWHVSMPVDAETGTRAVRLPGDVDGFGNPTAPEIHTLASRLNSQVRDDLLKAMVIVDVERLGDVNGARLTDYLAMVALAQVDPEGRFDGYDSVLAIFDNPGAAPDGLTEWDRSYLASLYRVLDDPQRRRNPNAVTGAVAGDMTRDRNSAGSDPEE